MEEFRRAIDVEQFDDVQTSESVYPNSFPNCRFLGKLKTGAILDIHCYSWEEALHCLPLWAKRPLI